VLPGARILLSCSAALFLTDPFFDALAYAIPDKFAVSLRVRLGHALGRAIARATTLPARLQQRDLWVLLRRRRGTRRP
jgi:hypothetical protein